MSATTVTAPAPSRSRDRPPAGMVGPVAWMRANLFGSWWSSAVTCLLIYLILRCGLEPVRLGRVARGLDGAGWRQRARTRGLPRGDRHRRLLGAGARRRYRFILFGFYPFDQQWRPALVVALFIGMFVVSANRRFWRSELLLIWIATLVVIGVLMWGGVLGLPYRARRTSGAACRSR